MPKMNPSSALHIIWQGASNLRRKRPLAMSLEITHSCNCNCEHCDKGGMIPDEELAPPERFGDVVRELNPLIAQISGGEPLLRGDVFEIVQEVKHRGKLPYLVFISNGWLLSEKKYLKLKRVGVDEFAISLDFPDERHDKNRGISGLYEHLSELIPRLASYGNHDITLISVIRSQTVPELRRLAEHALRWDVTINFSAYTPLRTGDSSKSIQGEEQLRFLREQLDYLIQFKRETRRIFTPESVLSRYYDFFANNAYVPNCRAGYRSLVVNPDGRLAPCAMQPCAFDTQQELIDHFSKSNTCGSCCVSLRANTERSVGTLIKDSWLSYRQMSRNTKRSCAQAV